MNNFELSCQIALSHSLISSRALINLVKVMGSAREAWSASENILKEHLSENQLEKLSAYRKSSEPERLLALYKECGIKTIPQNDENYPSLLKLIYDPPFLLYIRGNEASLNHTRTVAIVGTRRCTDYGKRVLDVFIEQIAPYEPSIISGLAAGIDSLSHRAALKNNLPTVAVFGTGIDQIYPKENESLSLQIIESGGALISELPIGVHGDKSTFPRRNRIIAGLTMGTIVIEGDDKSGALITAQYALDNNRHVMAVPGNIFSPASVGPNRLIQEGAVPVRSGEDICQAMNWNGLSLLYPAEKAHPPSALIEQLSREEKDILSLISYDPLSFEELHQKSRTFSVMNLQTMLTMLELNGLITALPGARFCRN